MRRVGSVIVAIGLALSPIAGHAADAHGHDKRGANGGELVDAGPYHLELVVKGQELALYVLDDKNGKVAVKEAKATATLMSGGSKATIALAPAGDNLLKGSGKFEPKEDMKVLVSLTLAGKAAQQARFTPFHKEGANQKGHKH